MNDWPRRLRAARRAAPGALLALFALLSALALGCTGGGGGGGGKPAGAGAGGAGTPGGAAGVSAPLSVAIDTPLGVESGHVEIDYTLIDGSAQPATIRVEYTIDGGRTWAPATEGIGSDGTAGLATARPPGARHRFVWDSFRDLGETFAPAAQVRMWVATAAQSAGAATFDFPLNNASAGPGLLLARGPYLQSVTASEARVVWRTSQPADGAVAWGETPALGRIAPGAPAQVEHEVLLSGLDPGREYWYQALANGLPIAPVERFRAAAAPHQTSFTFIVFGDSGKGNQHQWDVAQRMEMAGADFAIHVGDIVYSAGEYHNYDPRFFSPYRKMLSRMPIFPAMGNHDVVTLFGQPFVDNFRLPRSSGSEKYYTFTWGHAQFFCLDSSIPQLLTPLFPQHSWFVNEISASTATWKFVYFHHPPYSSGSHGSDRFLRAVLSPFIEQAEVDIVFNGHDHHYERTTPRRDYAATPRGTVYVVTGAAGALSTSPKPPSSFTAAAAWEPHFTRVVVQGNTLRAEAIRPDGTLIDAFDIVK